MRNEIYLMIKQNQSIRWALTELFIMTFGGLRGGFTEGSIKGFFGVLKLMPAALHERKHNPYTRRTEAAEATLAEIAAWQEGRRLPPGERDTLSGFKRLIARFRRGVDVARNLSAGA